MNNMRFQNAATAIGFIVLAVVVIWVLIPIGVVEPKKVKFVALSPSYYPRLVGYCLLIFGVLLLLRTVAMNPDSDQTATAEESSASRFSMLLPVTAVLFALYWFLESLGFVLAPALALVTLLLLAGERNIFAILLIAILLPFGLYVFFVHVANIPIPGGVLDPLLLRLHAS